MGHVLWGGPYILHELPCEPDSFVVRRRGHPHGFELLVKLLRMTCGD
jgi:hypothetical protein